MSVEFLDDEPNGIAAMIGGLIEANLRAHPDRTELLRPAVVGIVASDAEVGLTLRIAPGGVSVRNGIADAADVVVEGDSETLTELSSVPLRFGFPDALTAEGRAVTAKLLRGDLRVRGLATHPGVVSRLNRLLSVR